MLIRTLNNLCASRHLLFLAEIALLSIILACSNSQSIDDSASIEPPHESTFSSIAEDGNNTTSQITSSNIQDITSCNSSLQSSSSIIYTNYLPLDDSEYPYAGLPRIVIETENYKEIKDKETEIPAKLQIYGKDAPEGEIMHLTIKGRGNSTWGKPKKPYTITFEQKQPFLGMKKAKKWILLANYFDRTLIRNAVAFEVARKTQLEWTPSGKYAEIILNGKFLGNYYICEKVQINKERLNINEGSYLLEFDSHFDEDFKFKTSLKNIPVNIKNPNNPTKEQLNYIENHINTIENILYNEKKSRSLKNYIDIQTFADFFIVYELTQNSELLHPKSAYAYIDNDLLNAGPVWDFDWGTFTNQKTGLRNLNGIWFDKLLQYSEFKQVLQTSWNKYKHEFNQIPDYIDSLVEYIELSGIRNADLWPIANLTSSIPDKSLTFNEAITTMTNAYSARIKELDKIFNSL